MKSKLYLLTILGFLSVFGFAQEDSTKTAQNTPVYIEDFRITDLSERYANSHKGKTIDGYRVQLYSGSKDKANKTRKQAISKFPEIACILIYETPDFKVQMGNFRTEMEAEKYLQRIRVQFPGAFVVKSQIKLPDLKTKEEEAQVSEKPAPDPKF